LSSIGTIISQTLCERRIAKDMKDAGQQLAERDTDDDAERHPKGEKALEETHGGLCCRHSAGSGRRVTHQDLRLQLPYCPQRVFRRSLFPAPHSRLSAVDRRSRFPRLRPAARNRPRQALRLAP
jgi:hypothetical protein